MTIRSTSSTQRSESKGLEEGKEMEWDKKFHPRCLFREKQRAKASWTT